MDHWKQVAESASSSSNPTIVCCLPFAVVCTVSKARPPQHLVYAAANEGPLRRWPTAAARLGNHRSPNSSGCILLLIPSRHSYVSSALRIVVTSLLACLCRVLQTAPLSVSFNLVTTMQMHHRQIRKSYRNISRHGDTTSRDDLGQVPRRLLQISRTYYQPITTSLRYLPNFPAGGGARRDGGRGSYGRAQPQDALLWIPFHDLTYNLSL